LKAANPDERLADVVPLNGTGLPEIDTVPVAAVKSAPLSVNCTTGSGDITWPAVVLDGGSVEKASA